ncbi:hypothetical protein LX32DRAFT_278192 [Colletotrichum zoysiae]|uniref:Uncharacterized protein n=1 Tax=Colletotrichum zoysiae TaxID=1216348 RepID=A0AAD9H2K6_9PEZI|nr:hypothetical protein LX32DRAFT_278192 [Colletotrichum zoysiae]
MGNQGRQARSASSQGIHSRRAVGRAATAIIGLLPSPPERERERESSASPRKPKGQSGVSRVQTHTHPPTQLASCPVLGAGKERAESLSLHKETSLVFLRPLSVPHTLTHTRGGLQHTICNARSSSTGRVPIHSFKKSDQKKAPSSPGFACPFSFV